MIESTIESKAQMNRKALTEQPVEKLVEYRTAHYAARSEAAHYVTNTPAQVKFLFANPMICLLRSGQKIIRVDGGPAFTMGPGDVLFVPSNLGFNIDLKSASAEAPITCDCLEIEASHLDNILARFNEHGVEEQAGQIVKLDWKAHALVRKAEAESLGLDVIFDMFGGERDMFSDLLIETAIDASLLRLLRSRRDVMLKIADSLERDGISAALLLIRQHLDHHFSIPALADAANVSEATLRRHFRERMGTTPTRYANRMRVQEAKRALRESDESLKEMAFRLGFSDVSHLSRLFRLSTGESPSAYRSRQSRQRAAVQLREGD